MQNEELWKEMNKDNNDFLDYLVENDPLGLLKDRRKKVNHAKRSVLLNNFEEIVNFYEQENREPRNSSDNIKEFQLFCRLKSIREDANKIQQLKPYDLYQLLKGEKNSDITLDDMLGDDPLHLLEDEIDSSILKLKNVKKSDRIIPEYISRRKFCQDFEQYAPMFKSIQEDLENGTRKLAVYRSQELCANRFYVLGGIVVYLKSIDGETINYRYNSGERKRFDGRTECIFDNGTYSDMLFRSLDKALIKDGYSITDPIENVSSSNTITNDDKLMGYVYVLKSHHSKLKNENDVYKIGSTTTTVTERVKNAKNEPTYLYAGVEIVEIYKCFNITPRVMEDHIHSFFDKVRLNINIPCDNGVIISPREWFCIKLEAIREAVNLILADKINDYIYDPSNQKIVSKL